MVSNVQGENLMESFLRGFDSDGSGSFNRNQWINLCSHPSINMGEKMAESLFDGMDKDANNSVKIEDILREMSAWQADLQTSNTLPSTGSNLDESDHVNTDEVVQYRNKMKTKQKILSTHKLDMQTAGEYYEIDPMEARSPIMDSDTSVREFEEIISLQYPELLTTFHHLLKDFKSELKAKKSEKEQLEQHYMTEKEARKNDLVRLENEMEAEFKRAEENMQKKIRQELEGEFQDKISKKEQEIMQYRSQVEEIKQIQKKRKSSGKVNGFPSIADSFDYEGQSPITPSFKGHNFSLQQNNSTSDNYTGRSTNNYEDEDNEDELFTQLQNTEKRMKHSEQELRMLKKQLQVQADELYHERMNADEQMKKRSALEKQMTAMRDAMRKVHSKYDEDPANFNGNMFSFNDVDSSLYREDSGHFSGGMYPDSPKTSSHSSQLYYDENHHEYMNGKGVPNLNLEMSRTDISDDDFSRGTSLNSNVHVSLLDTNMTPVAPDRLFKVIMVGNSGVGKSCFLHRFCTGNFYNSLSSTVGVDFLARNVRMDQKLYTIQLWDTAGQEKFKSIVKPFFRKSDGAIIMYDVTNEKSFQDVGEWISLMESSCENLPTVIVGNKVDLRENANSDGRQTFVSTERGQKLADAYGANFMETSVKSALNVKSCVIELAKKMKISDDQNVANVSLDVVPATKSSSGCCSLNS